MKMVMKWLSCLSVIFVFVAAKAGAVPVLDQYWGTGDNPDPVWGVTDLSLPSGSPSSSGSSSVTLTFPTGWGSPAASLSTTVNNYQGNYGALGSGLTVKFDFNPQDVAPLADGGLQFYFQSGGNTWYANGATTPLVTGNQTYRFNIGSASAWTPGIGNLADWATAFANVQEIGFTVNGPNSGASPQIYTFSNIELFLSVPEPETLWMIVMVLASLGITFRGRLAEVAGQIKARIRA